MSGTRPPIAWIVRYFPAVSETFVHHEVAAAGEVLGAVPRVIALDPAPDGPVHDVSRRVEGQVAFVPRGHQPAVLAAGARRGGSLGALVAPEGPLARLRDAARAAWIAELCAREGIRRLHAHFAAEAAEIALAVHRLGGIPYSVTVHARDVHVPRPAARAVLEGADRVLAASADAAAAARALAPEIGPRLEVVKVGVPFPAAAVPPPPPGTPFRVLSVGRVVPKKGHDVLLRAFALLRRDVPDAELDVVGGGPEEGSLRARARLMDLPGAAVRFHGALADRDVERLLAAPPHCLALACRVAPDGDRDGIPVALMEAMARGIPVVTAAVGGIPELVWNGATGLVVPPDDPTALADALGHVAVDPRLAARIGDGGREAIRRYHHVDTQVRAMLHAVDSLPAGAYHSARS
ncbi:glycosyltransferase [Myxococcota bacterium]|nr:glycosyltransferase [Myxococcota bacterium]